MNARDAFAKVDSLSKECGWTSRPLIHGRNYRVKNRTVISVYSSNTDRPGSIEIAFDTKTLSSIARHPLSDAVRFVSKLQNEVASFAAPKTSYQLPRVSIQTSEQLGAVLVELKDFMGYGASAPASAPPKEDAPTNLADGEIEPDERVFAEILSRRGQVGFRERLLAAYEGQCAVTGCNAAAALEAAHVVPHSEHQSYEARHGILLRADIHTLFDLYLLSINPATGKVALAPELREAYSELQEKNVVLPANQGLSPDPQFLLQHFKRWSRKNAG